MKTSLRKSIQKLHRKILILPKEMRVFKGIFFTKILLLFKLLAIDNVLKKTILTSNGIGDNLFWGQIQMTMAWESKFRFV